MSRPAPIINRSVVKTQEQAITGGLRALRVRNATRHLMWRYAWDIGDRSKGGWQRLCIRTTGIGMHERYCCFCGSTLLLFLSVCTSRKGACIARTPCSYIGGVIGASCARLALVPRHTPDPRPALPQRRLLIRISFVMKHLLLQFGSFRAGTSLGPSCGWGIDIQAS